MSVEVGPSEARPFALGSSVYGGRPTFALTRQRVDGDESLTLYELLPESQAEARRERLKRVNRHPQVTTFGDAFGSADAAELTERSWDGWVAVKVARLSGGRLRTILSLVEETLLAEDIEPGAVTSTGDGELFLPETTGIRLALGFTGMKPLRRVDRMRALARGIARMSTEECYYWHAKCRSPASPNGEKALRVLLTDQL